MKALTTEGTPVCALTDAVIDSEAPTIHLSGQTIRVTGSGDPKPRVVSVTGQGTVIASGAVFITTYGPQVISDSATVRAFGSATVHALGKSDVTAYDSSVCVVCGQSKAHLLDGAGATVRDMATATCHPSHYGVVMVRGSASVQSRGAGQFVLYNHAHLSGSATRVVIYDTAVHTEDQAADAAVQDTSAASAEPAVMDDEDSSSSESSASTGRHSTDRTATGDDNPSNRRYSDSPEHPSRPDSTTGAGAAADPTAIHRLTAATQRTPTTAAVASDTVQAPDATSTSLDASNLSAGGFDFSSL